MGGTQPPQPQILCQPVGCDDDACTLPLPHPTQQFPRPAPLQCTAQNRNQSGVKKNTHVILTDLMDTRREPPKSSIKIWGQRPGLSHREGSHYFPRGPCQSRPPPPQSDSLCPLPYGLTIWEEEEHYCWGQGFTESQVGGDWIQRHAQGLGGGLYW